MKNDNDITAQFQGMVVEFNDKVTLFPVQVEKQTSDQRQHSRHGNNRYNYGRSNVRHIGQRH